MAKTDRTNNMSTSKKVWAILKFIILIGGIVGVTLYIYFAHHEILDSMKSVESIQKLFSDYKATSIVAYLVAQTLQIVICIIPGQWLQIAAGLAWGFFGGLLLSIVGALIGTVIAYYLAKLLGRDAMHLFFGEEKVNEYIERFNSRKSMIITFLIFLIPGVPKDLCCYVAGLSEMRLKPFLICSLVGRIPGMIGSILIGLQLGKHSWTAIIIIAAIFLALFILGVVFRKRIFAFLDNMQTKATKGTGAPSDEQENERKGEHREQH